MNSVKCWKGRVISSACGPHSHSSSCVLSTSYQFMWGQTFYSSMIYGPKLIIHLVRRWNLMLWEWVLNDVPLFFRLLTLISKRCGWWKPHFVALRQAGNHRSKTESIKLPAEWLNGQIFAWNINKTIVAPLLTKRRRRVVPTAEWQWITVTYVTACLPWSTNRFMCVLLLGHTYSPILHSWSCFCVGRWGI